MDQWRGFAVAFAFGVAFRIMQKLHEEEILQGYTHKDDGLLAQQELADDESNEAELDKDESDRGDLDEDDPGKTGR